jgi:hypothetical protein
MKPTRLKQALFGNRRYLGRLFVLLGLTVGAIQAQTATVDLPGATILAINNSGAVTGYYCEQDPQSCGPWSSNSRGFLRESNGTITTFDGTPRAINDAGTVAGYLHGAQVFGGFIRNKQGVVTVFDAGVPFFTDCGTYFMALNNREELAGYYSACYAPGIVHTIVVMRAKNGLITKFEVPADMIPTAINARGDLTAYFQGTEIRGYLVDRSGDVTLLVPRTPSEPLVSYPVAINNSGDVAGYFQPSSGPQFEGFLRDRDGTFTLFDGKPIAMNERGDIVGLDLSGGFFIRDASRGTISTLNCPAPTITSMNDRGDVAGGNVICTTR